MSCQRSGCPVGDAGPLATTIGVEASPFAGVDPGVAAGFAPFAGAALLASLLASLVDAALPGALLESVPGAMASLVMGLASESGGVAGIGGMVVVDAVSWTGGWGGAPASFAGSGAGVVAAGSVLAT
jgi:hypothetical protein